MIKIFILIMLINSITLYLFIYSLISLYYIKFVESSEVCVYYQNTEKLKNLRNKCFITNYKKFTVYKYILQFNFCYEKYINITNNINIDKALFQLPSEDEYLNDIKLPNNIKNEFKQIDDDVIYSRIDIEDGRSIKKQLLEEDSNLFKYLNCPPEQKYHKDIYKGDLYTVEVYIFYYNIDKIIMLFNIYFIYSSK